MDVSVDLVVRSFTMVVRIVIEKIIPIDHQKIKKYPLCYSKDLMCYIKEKKHVVTNCTKESDRECGMLSSSFISLLLESYLFMTSVII